MAKARLEDDSYRLHAHEPPEERRRLQIITLQQELVAEELNRDESDLNQAAKVLALYRVLRDKGVDVDKLREQLVSGGQTDSPVLLVNPQAATQRFAICESTPLSR